LLGFNTLPLLVGAVIDGLGLDARQAGLLGSVEIGAMAAASLLLAPRVGAIPRRRVAIASAAVVIGAHVLSAIPADFALLLSLRLLAGLGEGCIYAIANAVIASSVDPDRLYARVTLVGALAVAALFVAIPYAIEPFAHRGAFGSLAAVALFCVPLLLWLPRSRAGVTRIENPNGVLLRGPSLAVLASAFVLSVGEGAIWAFVERIGGHVGLSIDEVGVVLAITTVAGVSGAGLAAWLGTRFGRTIPLSLGITAIGAASVVLGYAAIPAAYVGAELAYNTAYLFVTPFLLGTAAAVDARGRVAAATGGMVLVGGALGPAVGGAVVAWGSYPPLGWLVVVCCALAISLILPTTFALDRGEEYAERVALRGQRVSRSPGIER
jgi:predicted MFS family arabinose efflux permease